MSAYTGNNIAAIQSTSNPMLPFAPVKTARRSTGDTYDISGLAAASTVEIYVGAQAGAQVVVDSIRWIMSSDPGAGITLSVGDNGSATRYITTADAHAAQTGVGPTSLSGSRYYTVPAADCDQDRGGYWIKCTLAGGTVAGAVGSGTVVLEVTVDVLDG